MDHQLVPIGTVQDIFGVDYQLVLMPSNGLCGFSSFAYCVTGDICAHSDIIDDCFTVFHQNPQLFILQTEFGRKQPNLSQYCSSMRYAVSNVSNQSVPSILWLEDAHLLAYSMLYDIAVYVYKGDEHRWVVYNDTGSRGYICLYFTGSHFDVIRGIDGRRPPIPPSAERQNCMSWHPVQLNKLYTFCGVWSWPARESVNIVSEDSPSHAHARLYTYADVLKSGSPETTDTADKQHAAPTFGQPPTPKKPVMENSRAVHQEEESGSSVHKCTVCCREFDSLRGLRAHCSKVHTVKPSASKKAAQPHSDSRYDVTAPDSVSCSVCRKVFMSVQGLRLHQFRSHEVSGMDDVRRLEMRTQDAVTGNSSCELCNMSFDSKAALSKHLIRVHPKRKLPVISDISHDKHTKSAEVPCEQPLCQTDVKRAVDKDARVRGKQLCSGCGKFFVNITNHKKCSKRLIQATDANSVQLCNENSNSGLSGDDRVNSDQAESSDNRGVQQESLLKCTICDKVCKTVAGLQMHNVKVHSLPSADNSTHNTGAQYDSLIKCTICDKVFKTAAGLRMHNLKVHRVPSASTSTVSSAVSDSVQREEVVHMTTRSQAQSSQNTGEQQQEQSSGEARSWSSPTSSTPSQAQSSQNTSKEQQEQSSGEARSWSSPTSPRLKTTLKRKMEARLVDFQRQFSCINQDETSALNESHGKLKQYHDSMLQRVQNTATEKLCREVQDVVEDCSLIDSKIQSQQAVSDRWTAEDGERLKGLNASAKSLPVPDEWYWAAKDDTERGQFNKKRLEFCMETELQAKIIHCPQCDSTGILVGLDQIESEVCYDCLLLYQLGATKKAEAVKESWKSVRPVSSSYPKRVEQGHEHEDLPELTPGEKALIAAVHPVVTVTKNFMANKKFRQENISLLQNSQQTWANVLPRTNLHSRFMIIERRFKNSENKYIIANPEKVRQWLGYLFKHHKEYIRMNRMGQLELSSDAIGILEN